MVNTKTGKPFEILLIESNPDSIRLIQKLLDDTKMASFQIEDAKKLSDAIKTLSEKAFDLILLNLSLSDSSGIKTFENLHSKARQIAIVILANLCDEGLALEAVRKGAQDFLLKDQVDDSLLPRSIIYAIERKNAEMALRTSEKRYRNILESIEDAYFEVDVFGNLIFYNDSVV